jgi:hypothetical protein
MLVVDIKNTKIHTEIAQKDVLLVMMNTKKLKKIDFYILV